MACKNEFSMNQKEAGWRSRRPHHPAEIQGLVVALNYFIAPFYCTFDPSDPLLWVFSAADC
jgi:hypothetical protein